MISRRQAGRTPDSRQARRPAGSSLQNLPGVRYPAQSVNINQYFRIVISYYAMLRELSIKNFAIIDDLHIRFDSGFTIMSGETGAGKSIIINAVNLILGSRAAAGWIRTGSETAEIEAFFEIDPNGSAARIMAANDLDPSEGLMIRRIIAQNNRHRIYINQHPATIRLLAVISENLACISGQHAHQGLLDEDQHLRILDQFGGLLPFREAVRERFRELSPLIRNLDDLKGKKAHQGEQIELLGFQKRGNPGGRHSAG